MYLKVMAFLAALQLKDDHKGEIYISITGSKAVVTMVPALTQDKIDIIPADMRVNTTLITDGDQSIITIQG